MDCYFVSLYCPSKWGSQYRPVQVTDIETFNEFKQKALMKMNLFTCTHQKDSLSCSS